MMEANYPRHLLDMVEGCNTRTYHDSTVMVEANYYQQLVARCYKSHNEIESANVLDERYSCHDSM